MITPREWETEILPARPRLVAVQRVLPDPGAAAMYAIGAAGMVAGQTWLVWLAIAVGLYALLHLRMDARHGVACETADHWLGDGPLPEGMTQTCPHCRHIPLRVLWRGRSGGGR